MLVSISDPVLSTQVFTVLVAIVFLLTLKKHEAGEFFCASTTQELKGLAILAIVLSHIGYFLVTDDRFLFPLSILAGVGVDLFLLLSGFGLTLSTFKKELRPLEFYKKRLLRLFRPFWLVLGSLFLMDYLLLGRSYGAVYIIRSMLGIFPRADLYGDINSPLWYLTLLLVYYVLYPLVLRKKHYAMGALLLYVLVERFVAYGAEALTGVMHLWELHLMAFPLGVLLAGLVASRAKLGRLTEAVNRVFSRSSVRCSALLFLACYAAYFSYNSGIGRGALVEELNSIMVALAIVGIFLLKRFDSRLLSVLGLYSYEIYLVHWPLMYRYDVFYKYFPGWLATLLYLAFFIGLGYLIQKVDKAAGVKLDQLFVRLESRFKRPPQSNVAL